MVFISSIVPFENLITEKELPNNSWFVLNTNIKNKDYEAKGNGALSAVYQKLLLYKDFYTDLPLYCYLMTDNYYRRTEFSKTNPNLAEAMRIEKIPHSFSEMQQFPDKYKMIEESEQVLSKNNIDNVFKAFRNHNFKENPICEVVLRGSA